MTPPLTGQQALRAGIARLSQAGVPDPARDARLLLAHAWGVRADRLTLALPDALPAAAQQAFDAALSARAARQPVSQITGHRAFWGRSFIVTPDVLDPRPETETLIESALSLRFSRVLDLGTGSGAILLSLLAERPQATGQGVDLSDAALAVAQRNAVALGVQDRADLTPGDWFGPVTGRFDLIVSNPPYIDAADLPTLAPEVRDHEPAMALTPGPDGVSPYRLLTAQAPHYLHAGGWLIVEIGHTQGAAVADMMRQAGFERVEIIPDLSGKDRVVRGVYGAVDAVQGQKTG